MLLPALKLRITVRAFKDRLTGSDQKSRRTTKMYQNTAFPTTKSSENVFSDIFSGSPSLTFFKHLFVFVICSYLIFLSYRIIVQPPRSLCLFLTLSSSKYNSLVETLSIKQRYFEYWTLLSDKDDVKIFVAKQASADNSTLLLPSSLRFKYSSILFVQICIVYVLFCSEIK